MLRNVLDAAKFFFFEAVDGVARTYVTIQLHRRTFMDKQQH